MDCTALKLRRGDRAFAGATDIDCGFGFLRLMGLEEAYPRGFRMAAEFIVQKIKSSQEIHQEYEMVLPACFLYRHYLELEMKYILSMADKTGVMAVAVEDLTEHLLYPLWNKTRKAICRLFPEEKKLTLDAMEAIIQQFHIVDRSNEEFRYSKRMDRKESLQKLPNDFSLDNLLQTMAKVRAYFAGISETLTAKFDGLICANASSGNAKNTIAFRAFYGTKASPAKSGLNLHLHHPHLRHCPEVLQSLSIWPNVVPR